MDSELALAQPNSVLLETTLPSQDETRTFLFSKPVEVLAANTFNDLESLIKKIDSYIERGFYLAGYLSYEAGYLFEEGFRRPLENFPFAFPLAWFGVYENPRITESTANSISPQQDSFAIHSLSMNLSQAEYEEKVLKILDYIKRGETYQVNFTFRVGFDLEGNPFHLYEALKKRQRVAYSAIVHDGKRQILSLSPELFFKRKNNTLLARPMKGTSPRGKSELDDRNLLKELSQDSKTKAENSMIVDLIRNDFGKIAKLGTVQVEKLRQIEKYETLFQMTSTVKSTLKESVDYYQLFKALLPGGSITGAPKYRTMQIIQELESTFRDVYTGAIGFISKEEAIFNIPIRTIVLENGKGTMGVGSGIVWDSNPKREYEECIVKQRFLLGAIPLQLIESILLRNGKPTLLSLHLQRLEKSANFFGFSYNEEEIVNAITQYSKDKIDKSSKVKLRLELFRDGKLQLEHSNIQIQKKSLGRIKLSQVRINSKNIFQSHKTTIRKTYNEEYKRAMKEGFMDFVFLNEKEEVVETSIYNLFIKKDNQYYTPPLSSGALPGVMREYLLKKGKLKEKTLTIADLQFADRVYLCNSVRGIMRVSLE
ncbi:MAG: aminodeoxychorismate synthase component I [Leptospiraceae bacterium]|nr:aminodeoxychorismate synthase component I [Leptospiraceae bacterium]MBP9162218.1 aminodeoxychorismate synthase component I [Leptospiraceae bacterium]